MANYSIPNPGRYATTQKFSKIHLDRLTNSPGKFTKLSSFTIYVRIIGTSYPIEAPALLLDDIVFTRSMNKDERRCRMPGGLELNVSSLLHANLTISPNVMIV